MKKNSPEVEREYVAFISYRHLPLDMEAARSVQKKIESYVVPKELRARAGGKRLGNVFRDEDELPASASLSGSITYALDHSRFLIVICTPGLPQSKWCEQEIRYFLQTHDRDHVLAVLADGEPERSFSPLMLHTFDEQGNVTGDAEPLAANIAGADHRINRRAFRKEIIRIYAALLGCPFDTLWQRQRRARTTRMLAAMAAAMAVMGIFMGTVLYKNRQITEQNRQITEQNGQITRQNLQISEQNDQITAQNLELKRQMSSLQVESGRAQLEDHDVLGALRSVLAALPEEDGQPYDHLAEALLNDALCSYQSGALQSRLLYSQSMDIVDLAVTKDDKAVLLADSLGFVRCVSLRDGTLLWETRSPEQPGSNDAMTDLLLLEERGLVVCKNTRSVCARKLQDGSPVWTFAYQLSLGCNFYCLSPDGGTLMLLDQEEYDSGVLDLLALDTATGLETGRVRLGSEEQPLSVSTMDYSYGYGAAFSDDGRLFAIVNSAKDEERLFLATLLDAESWQVLRTASYKGAGSSSLFYGVHVQNGSGDLFCAQYESGYGGVMTIRIVWEDREQPVKRDLTNKTLGTRSGLTLDLYDEQTVVGMLSNDRMAAVFSQGDMFLYNLSEGTLMRGYAYTGNIVAARWDDREEEQLTFFTSDGVVARFDLDSDSQSILRYLETFELDQSGISLAARLSDGSGSGMYLTVPSSARGRLLSVHAVSDPSGERLSKPEGSYSGSTLILPSPSGERIFFFFPGSDKKLSVVVCDAKTRKELARAEFSASLLWNRPVVLSEDSFVLEYTVYHMDGTTEYLERLTEDVVSKFWSGRTHSVTLCNGQVLSVADVSASMFRTLLPCWLDGKLLESSQDVDTGIAFVSCSSLIPGANGYVIGYGECAVVKEAETQEEEPAQDETHEYIDPDEISSDQDETHEYIDPDEASSEQNEVHPYIDIEENAPETDPPAFYVFDALHETHLLIADPFPEEGERNILPGTETPVMLCWDEQSRIYLISLTDGSARALPFSYLPGEIQAMCFTPGDTHVAVLTGGGSLDIYELASGEMVFSETPSLFRSASVSYIQAMSCRFDRSGTRLLIITDYIGDNDGCFFVIDPEEWLLLAQLAKVYTCLPEDNSVYTLSGSSLMRYPFHTLEDLAAMAEEQLG
ncbi:MAG: TIR domain-containing protein [Oscillospiraceae bacterium]|nr:TIR domain-containing protein [Oscillospiraceae bacterium]